MRKQPLLWAISLPLSPKNGTECALPRFHQDLIGIGVYGIDFPEVLPRTKHAHHLFTIWVDPDKRDGFMNKLQEEGIGVAVNYRPVHLLTYYRKTFGFEEGMFPKAEIIGKRTISLPMYPNMGEDAVAKVIEAVKKAVKMIKNWRLES